MGATVTSLEVVNSIRSSALRSIPSAMIAIYVVSFALCLEIPVEGLGVDVNDSSVAGLKTKY